MSTLLLAEYTSNVISNATQKALTAALQLGAPVDVFVCGDAPQAAAEMAAKLAGVHGVIMAQGVEYKDHLAEPIAALLLSLKDNYTHFVCGASSFGKNIMPRLAALLDVMQISDITAVISADTFERPIYAGNAIETVQSLNTQKVITVRTSAFAASEIGNAQVSIKTVLSTGGFANTKFVNAQIVKAERPELGSARVIISGGRALGSADAFKSTLEPLADVLNAAIGASRAAVDAGYAANDLQVGQTGKIVAPELYIAVGISGAIQHLAGMKNSKVIVAINKDVNAPIFKAADYGVVGDLFELVPQLTKALS